MSAEVWSIIATGIVTLIAIATSNRALCREMIARLDRLDRRIDELERRINELGERVNGRFDELGVRLDGRINEWSDRIGAIENRLLEHVGDMRERLGRIEGLLEGLWAAGRGRRERSGDVHGPQRTTGLP